MGPTLYEAARLQPVDEASDVGWIAPEPSCEITHGQGLIGHQLAEGHCLRRRELELRRDGAEMSVDALERNPHEQCPDLVSEAHVGLSRGNTALHIRIILNDLV